MDPNPNPPPPAAPTLAAPGAAPAAPAAPAPAPLPAPTTPAAMVNGAGSAAASPAPNGPTPMQVDAVTPNLESSNPAANGSVPGPSSAPAAAAAEVAAATAAAVASAAGPPALPLPPATRLEEDLARKELSLAELIMLMDEYKPLVPDAVTDYYLGKSGFQCDDVRIKRVLALAAQKFIADVATDALHFCKVRQQSVPARKPSKKHVLTMEDLSSALAEYGVTVKKPEYLS
ncbi:Transcription initiation factor TFIID subunit 10 [Allomyces arbusculus]|nr:Transcription initiation factor TFIID subunit 10 [Allomyces arbusculus]